MPEELPLHRFAEFAPLTDDEVAQVRALGEPPVRLRRRTVIRREGDEPRFAWLLLDGWVGSSILLSAGERQLVKFHLPGDILGSTSVCFTAAVDTLFALTPATVSRVPMARFIELFRSSPRFAARMFLSAQRERVALMDRLASIGRTPAIARVAGMLLDLHDRLRHIGHVAEDGFDVRVTQEEIGDYLGLTAVHVNRVLRQLQNERLIRRRLHRIAIVDPDGLRQRAGQTIRTLDLASDWVR